jgi:hypothetical protein
MHTQLENLKDPARFIVAHVSPVLPWDECLLTNRAFIEGIDLERLRFDTDEMREGAMRGLKSVMRRSFDSSELGRFRADFLESDVVLAR